jgi:hypothetical protein
MLLDVELHALSLEDVLWVAGWELPIEVGVRASNCFAQFHLVRGEVAKVVG